MELLFGNIETILAAGFLGLAFLFVYLAYTNVKTIVSQKDPNPAAVSLSRSFMWTALAFMVCAGPLQFGLLWFQGHVENRPVTIYVAMAHEDWETTFGDLKVVDQGAFHSIVGKRFEGTRNDKGEVLVDASELVKAYRTVLAQVAGLNDELSNRSSTNIRQYEE